jgi:hypothetical protein
MCERLPAFRRYILSLSSGLVSIYRLTFRKEAVEGGAGDGAPSGPIRVVRILSRFRGVTIDGVWIGE